MRWMWIDRIVELVPRERMIAIKHVSMAEEHLHDHFPSTETRRSMPMMPMSLIVEGMAQTAGVLVGHAEGFMEKVVLAKVSKAKVSREATPGCTLRYTATIDQFTPVGASTKGVVELIDPNADGTAEPEVIGHIDLLFSHLDNNMSGVQYPEENFVFSESFKTLMQTSGIEADF
jgi:3-hydroxyacyl-[acyl-carrier-protein] dehydratase